LCKLSKAQEGHEHSTSILLRRNADVTVVDESGRTAVDLAQTRSIQTVLRQAWNDARCEKFVADNVAASNHAAAADGQSPACSITESPEQLKSSVANPPRVRAHKLLKPFVRQSKSLDQPECGDMNRNPSTQCTRVGINLFSYAFCAFFCLK